MNSIKKIVTFSLLLLSLSACGQVNDLSNVVYNKHENLKNITMKDIVEKNKDKQKLIAQINPAEEYVIDTYFSSFPVAERKIHENDSLEEIVTGYEKTYQENIPEGKMQAKDLKWKYLVLDHAMVLLTQSYSQADIGIMKMYTATFLGSPKMNEMRNEKVGDLISQAKEKYPEEYKDLVKKEAAFQAKLQAEANVKAQEQVNAQSKFEVPMRLNSH